MIVKRTLDQWMKSRKCIIEWGRRVIETFGRSSEFIRVLFCSWTTTELIESHESSAGNSLTSKVQRHSFTTARRGLCHLLFTRTVNPHLFHWKGSDWKSLSGVLIRCLEISRYEQLWPFLWDCFQQSGSADWMTFFHHKNESFSIQIGWLLLRNDII